MDFPADYQLVKQGAEAKIYKGTFLGRPVIVKERFCKTYRHPELEAMISKERLKAEARGILRCKALGVPAPAVYYVDPDSKLMYLEEIDGSTMKDLFTSLLASDDKDAPDKLKQLSLSIGEAVGKIHAGHLIHGDLTTSNFLRHGFKTYLIDFGLSSVSTLAEDKAVDLYVLERALISTHPGSDQYWTHILASYSKSYPSGSKEVLNKFKEVQSRGRKRTMVG
ncbi:RIO1 family [Nesidiocoris tenuis]|uniref:non-specific serine/threonine protein kinase n=1 Tax=Nesidiocoris tenuis TaxID=355587 RepID=A0ABN7AS97_9HEMI|nr:RIO1 family [Nesidiocoris tenuis]